MILRGHDQKVKEALRESMESQLKAVEDDVFDTKICKQMFVVNEVNLINRPKRLLRA